MPSDSERFVVCEVCKLEVKFCKCEDAMTPTDRDQQDREAFEKWCPHDRFKAIRQQAWQAALAYERGKSGWQDISTAPKITDVLCLLESGRCEVLYLTDNGEGFINTWRNLDGTASGYWPSHWMTLPSPPATRPQERNDDAD